MFERYDCSKGLINEDVMPPVIVAIINNEWCYVIVIDVVNTKFVARCYINEQNF